MLLDINLIQGKDMFCYESAIASLAAYLKRGHEMIYIDAWRLSLSPEDECHPQTIGSRISVGYRNKWNIDGNLEKYHGVRMQWNQADAIKRPFESLVEELHNGYPVLAVFDSYFSPWATLTEKESRFLTFFLITGIDESCDMVYCIDIHCRKKVELLSVEQYFKGFKGCCTFRTVGEEFKHFDVNAVIRESIKAMTENSNRGNSFSHIREISEEIRNSYDVLSEFEGKSSPTDVDIVLNIENLGRSRFLYSNALKYIFSLCGAQELLSISDKFVQISNNWHRVRYLIIKAFYSRKVEHSFYEKIADQISCIADSEEMAAQSLLDLTHRNALKNEGIAFSGAHKITPEENLEEMFYVDLGMHMNNKAFCSMDAYNNADLSGTGQFLLRNEHAEEEIWKFSNMNFSFPVTKSEEADNISCSGQSIPVSPGSYKSIMLLGCSVWGSFSEKLEIIYIDDDREEVTFEFTNWSTNIPAFGETVAWHGEAGKNEKNGIELLGFQACLFAKRYSLKRGKQIKLIQLPDYPNMHLFGMTLCR